MEPSYPRPERHTVSETVSEFSFLAEQARPFGVTVPAAKRVSVPTQSGRQISALRFGEAAPKVTFLHGAGLNAHTFDTTVLNLPLAALSIDLPGHGDSSWREDAAYTPSNLADDVIIALDELTSSPQILVGHSLGGLTAAAVAARRPDLVDRVVFVDIVPGLDPSLGPAQLRAFYSKIEFDSRDEVVDYAMSFGMGGERASAERGVFFNTRVRDDGRVEWKHHFARLAHDILPTASAEGSFVQNEESWKNFTSITAPVTLVRGETGYLNPEAVEVFRERMPRAQIVTVSAGHNVQETQPVTLASIIASEEDGS